MAETLKLQADLVGKPASKPRLTRERRAMLWIVGTGLLLTIVAYDPALGMGGDNAEYLVLARSLAERHDYSVISLPDPHPETQRPPGYPALLALFMTLLGQELWVLSAICLPFLALSAWAAWSILRCQQGSTLWATGAAVLLFFWNWDIIFLGFTIGSEMPYTALTLLTLYTAIRYVGTRDTSLQAPYSPVQPADERRRLLWLGATVVLAAAAIYVRPNGVTLIPALAVYLALHRQWRGLLFALIAGTILLAPLGLMQHRAMEAGRNTYMKMATIVEDGTGDRQAQGLRDLALRTLKVAAAQTLNLGHTIIRRPASWSLHPRPVIADDETAARKPETSAAPSSSLSPLKLVRRSSRYVLGLIVLFGFVISWRGGGSIVHWFTLMNILLLVATPFPRGRYLMPLIPLWGWFLAMAALWIGQRLSRMDSRRLGHGLIAAAVGAAMLCTTVSVAQQLWLNWECRGLPYAAPQRYGTQGSDFANYAAAAGWITRNTPQNAVIVCRKPPNIYWITGRASTWNPLWKEDADLLWQDLTDQRRYGPVYIIQDGFANRFQGDLTARNLKPALQAHREQIEPVATFEDPHTVIWRLKDARP